MKSYIYMYFPIIILGYFNQNDDFTRIPPVKDVKNIKRIHVNRTCTAGTFQDRDA